MLFFNNSLQGKNKDIEKILQASMKISPAKDVLSSGDADALFIYKLCTQTPKKQMSKFFENFVMMEIFL